jgi:DNA-binding HxlR family transcriptional regulator
MTQGAPRKVAVATLERTGECCPHLHEAVELIGKRWTGAIVYVLLHAGPMRFTEIGGSIPQLSDRLLSERMKELEAEGIVERRVIDDTPVRVEYALTDKGKALVPLIEDMREYGRRWLGVDDGACASPAELAEPVAA